MREGLLTPKGKPTDRRVPHESLGTLHSSSRNDGRAHGFGDPLWYVRLFQFAGERPARGGLPRDSGERRLSRRNAGDHGEQRGHSPGTPVHANPWTGNGDLEQWPSAFEFRVAIRSEQESGRGGHGRSGGDHPGDWTTPGRPAKPSDVHENESQ